ncbi:MAG: hypothetical protein AAF466_14475, partial [Bacteroidota bacterium]
LPTKGFQKHYQPLYNQSEQLEATIKKIEGELSDISTKKKSTGEIIKNSQSLYSNWFDLTHHEKREVLEAITNKIIFDGQGLTFKLKRISAPRKTRSLSELTTNGQTTDWDYSK